MEKVGKFTVFVIGILFNCIINGYVFLKLWEWFIIPIFKVHSLNIVQSIGILLFINFIRLDRDKESIIQNYWEEFVKSIIKNVVIAVVALLFGWTITLFM